MWTDTLLIVFISICTALLGEGLTWLMVYRTEKYQKLKAEVEKQSKKLEKRKETHGDSLDKQHKKKIEREEERLKNNNRDLSFVKMKSMFAIGFAFTALLSMFNTIFDGRVVARLPFQPLPWIQGLSHRNLPGEDYYDCSFIFLYILCTMSIRQNIQKILGFAPSRAASKQGNGLFGPAPGENSLVVIQTRVQGKLVTRKMQLMWLNYCKMVGEQKASFINKLLNLQARKMKMLNNELCV